MSLALSADTIAKLGDRRYKAKAKKPRESKIRKLLKTRVEAYGGEIRAVSWIGRSNAPDVLALFSTTSRYARLHFNSALHPFVETKRPGEDATEAQAREHARMRAAGCVVKVITNEQELDSWLPPLKPLDLGPW